MGLGLKFSAKKGKKVSVFWAKELTAWREKSALRGMQGAFLHEKQAVGLKCGIITTNRVISSYPSFFRRAGGEKRAKIAFFGWFLGKRGCEKAFLGYFALVCGNTPPSRQLKSIIIKIL